MEDRRFSPQQPLPTADHFLSFIGAAGSEEALSHGNWAQPRHGIGRMHGSNRGPLPLDSYPSGGQPLPLTHAAAGQHGHYSGLPASCQSPMASQTQELHPKPTLSLSIVDTERDRGPLSPRWAEDYFEMPTTNSPKSMPGHMQMDLTERAARPSYPSSNGSTLGSYDPSDQLLYQSTLPNPHESSPRLATLRSCRNTSPQTSGPVGLSSVCTSPYSGSNGSSYAMSDAESHTTWESQTESLNASHCHELGSMFADKETISPLPAMAKLSNGRSYSNQYLACSHIPRVSSPLRISSTIPSKPENQPPGATFGTKPPSLVASEGFNQRNLILKSQIPDFHFEPEQRSCNNLKCLTAGFEHAQQAPTPTFKAPRIKQESPTPYEGSEAVMFNQKGTMRAPSAEESGFTQPEAGTRAPGLKISTESNSSEDVQNHCSSFLTSPTDSTKGSITHSRESATALVTECRCSSEGAGSTPRDPSPVSSDGELIKPLPRTRRDEMLHRVMKDCEAMFHYFLGFGLQDDRDDSGSPESQYDEDSSDLEDEDSTVASVLSPVSPNLGRRFSPDSAIPDAKVKQHPTTGQSNRGSETPRSTTTAITSSQSTHAPSKRKVNDSGSSRDGNNGEDGRKKRRKGPEPEGTGQHRKLACPFFQRCPAQIPKASACVYPGFSGISRLKEHLYRCHLQPPHCARCYDIFISEDALKEHYRATERCVTIADKPAITGIDENQVKKIRCRKKKAGVESEEVKWIDIFGILFPDDDTVPSPYCDYDLCIQHSQLSPSSVSFREFEDYIRHNLPILIREELDRVAQSEEELMEERLRGQVVEIARRASENLLSHFRTTTNNNGTPSNESTHTPIPSAQDHTDSRELGAVQTASTRSHIAVQNLLAVPPSPAANTVDARTLIAQSYTTSDHYDGTAAFNAEQSDSAYGTLASSSHDPHGLQARVPADQGTMQQHQIDYFGDADTSSSFEGSNHPAAAEPSYANTRDPSIIMYASYNQAPPSQLLGDAEWPMLNNSMDGQWGDLFHVQAMHSEQFPTNSALLPPYSGPHIEGDSPERRS